MYSFVDPCHALHSDHNLDSVNIVRAEAFRHPGRVLSWSVVQDWSTASTWSWTPTAAGTCDVACHVRNGKHQGPSGWDDYSEGYSCSVVLGTITSSWLSGLVTMYGERSHDIGGPSEIAQTSEPLLHQRTDLCTARDL